MGFRRFSLRGHKKVSLEWDLVCLAYNVKRLHRLGTAALGIVVAVPAYLAYAFLSAKVRSIMHELERAGIEIVNLIEDARNNDNIVEFPQEAEMAPIRLELTSRSRNGKK